jgi:hypothetical protein
MGPFYEKYVKLPASDTPLSPFIANNPKFYPFLIPPALAALHNFIMEFDPGDLDELMQTETPLDPNPGLPHDHGYLSQRRPGRVEKERAEGLRDKIASEMWVAYQEVLQGREQEIQDYLDLENIDDMCM